MDSKREREREWERRNRCRPGFNQSLSWILLWALAAVSPLTGVASTVVASLEWGRRVPLASSVSMKSACYVLDVERRGDLGSIRIATSVEPVRGIGFAGRFHSILTGTVTVPWSDSAGTMLRQAAAAIADGLADPTMAREIYQRIDSPHRSVERSSIGLPARPDLLDDPDFRRVVHGAQVMRLSVRRFLIGEVRMDNGNATLTFECEDAKRRALMSTRLFRYFRYSKSFGKDDPFLGQFLAVAAGDTVTLTLQGQNEGQGPFEHTWTLEAAFDEAGSPTLRPTGLDQFASHADPAHGVTRLFFREPTIHQNTFNTVEFTLALEGLTVGSELP